MEAVSGSGKAYLVRRRTDSWVNGRLTAGTVVRAFTDRTAAEAFCEQSERQARLDRRVVAEVLTDPEFVRSPFELTSFDPPVFRDWLEDAGIPPPPLERWDGQEDVFEKWLWDLSLAQRERLYEGLHNFRSREVVEIDLVEGAYLHEDWEQWEAQAERWRLHPEERPQPPQDPPGVLLGEEDIPF